MKQLLFIMLLATSAAVVSAQDVITLKSGEIINGKVSEVGVNEIKYYKAANVNGPVYVTGKADVAHISYANGSTDVFASNPANSSTANNVVVVPQQPAPQTIIVQQPVRNYDYYGYRSYNRFPVIVPHIDLGHIGFGHRSYSRHGRHH